jgi:hypothetical protein
VETEERPAVFGFQGEKFGEKKKLTRGSHRAVRGREKEGTGSVRPGVGRGPFWSWARKGSRGPVFIFFTLLFFFPFSVFLFLFYLLQICLKSTQTTFRNFLKFKVSKWDSKKQVFKIKYDFPIKLCELGKRTLLA